MVFRRFPRRDVPPVLHPATYLVVGRPCQRRAPGLVRIWRTRWPSPRPDRNARPQYRRRGVARALLGQSFRRARRPGDTM